MRRQALCVICFMVWFVSGAGVRAAEVRTSGSQIQVTATSERVLDVLFSIQKGWKSMPCCIIEDWPEEFGFVEMTDNNGRVSRFGVKSYPINFQFSGKASNLLNSLASNLEARFVSRKESGKPCYQFINRDFYQSSLWPLNDSLDPQLTSSSMTISQCCTYLQLHHHMSYPPGACPLSCEAVNRIGWTGYFKGATVRDMVQEMARSQDRRKVIECYPNNLTQFERTSEDGVYLFPAKGQPVDWAINS